MKKIILLLVLQLFAFSNSYSELTIKIDRAEIGALPIMIHIDQDSKNYPAKEFKDIIENDLYSSGYFNVLDSLKVKNTIKNKSTQYALWNLAGANYFLKADIYSKEEKDFITIR